MPFITTARKLNSRPRKRLRFGAPSECFDEFESVLHFKVDVRPGRQKLSRRQ